VSESLSIARIPDANANALEWLNYGNLLWRFRREEEAVSAFDRAISLQSDLGRAYYGKGLALRDREKLPEALAALNKVTQIAPNFSPAWRWKGNMMMQLERYSEALTAYDKAIELTPDDFVYHLEKGYILGKLKRFREQLSEYNEALKLKLTLVYTIIESRDDLFRFG
jgi:tetratricopeptide (TPR) repeat protein